MATFKIDQIKILLDISDPAVKEPVPFTKSVLYHPLLETGKMAELSEYPYFTKKYKYSKTKLLNQPYDKRVNFFFNKDKFNKYIRLNVDEDGPESYGGDDVEEETKLDKIDNYLEGANYMKLISGFKELKTFER
jgi:hypothetical protein